MVAPSVTRSKYQDRYLFLSVIIRGRDRLEHAVTVAVTLYFLLVSNPLLYSDYLGSECLLV